MAYVAFTVPALAIAPIAGYLRETEVARQIMIIGGIVCLMAVAMHLLGLGTDRSNFDHTLRLGFEAVNPITLGHVATSTILAAVTLLHYRASMVVKIFAVAMLPVALTCLVLAASRGPFLALFVSALVYIIYRGNRRTWLFVTIALGVGVVAFVASGEGSQLLVRFEGIDEERSALERLVLQGNAIAQFLDHPLLGSAFLELEFLAYPHNMFIETAMALGIMGLALMGGLLIKVSVETNRRLRTGQILVPLLLVQYFLGFQFSGALWGYATFWGLVAIVLGARRNRPARAMHHITRESKAIAPPDAMLQVLTVTPP